MTKMFRRSHEVVFQTDTHLYTHIYTHKHIDGPNKLGHVTRYLQVKMIGHDVWMEADI